MSLEVELRQALDECLEAGREETAAGSPVSARYPELAPELEPLLAVAAELRARPPLPMPSPEFRARLARQLAQAPAPRSLRRSRLPVFSLAGLSLRRPVVYAAAVLTACIAFLMVGAVGASASATPGQPTYWLKRRLETVRLLLAGDQAVAVHRALADRRLDEALAAPAYGGLLLADFSREVTAALVEADEALQAGADRSAVADPLLVWLHGCRERLLQARSNLPPTAWRAAMALVEEAIAALTADGLSSSIVPRLADARQLLRARWLAGGGWSDEPGRDSQRYERHAALVMPVEGRASPAHEAARSAMVNPESSTHRAWPAVTAAPSVVTGREQLEPPPSPPATPADPPRGQPPAEPRPAPTEPPAPVPPPSATSAPSDPPTSAPPAEASVTATIPPPSSPTPSATPEATATAALPEIVYLACFPQTIEVYGQSRCEVQLANAQGLQLSYLWSTDWGVIYNADQPVAMFHAVLSMGGISKFDAPVRITVRTDSGLELSGETVVFVVPRLSQIQGPDGWPPRAPAAGTCASLQNEACHAR